MDVRDEMLLCDEANRLITAAWAQIPWQPIATMPDDRQDGREMLLHIDGGKVVIGWSETNAFYPLGGWRTDAGRLDMVDITHWADITLPQ